MFPIEVIKSILFFGVLMPILIFSKIVYQSYQAYMRIQAFRGSIVLPDESPYKVKNTQSESNETKPKSE